jgi:hypothetical protein
MIRMIVVGAMAKNEISVPLAKKPSNDFTIVDVENLRLPSATLGGFHNLGRAVFRRHTTSFSPNARYHHSPRFDHV